MAALEDVARVINGGTPKTKVSEYWGGPHLWITPAEMGGLLKPYLRDSRRSLTDEGLAHSSASLLPPKSVILSTRAPIGHLVINEKPMAFNQGCRGIVPGEGLHHKFLYYWLLSNVKRLDDLGSGTTFKELAAGKLKKFPIPTPPLRQQRRIVAILGEAFAGIEQAIANTEKNLDNAREVFSSNLNATFSEAPDSWALLRLDELCSIKHGFAFKSQYFSETGHYVLLTPGSFWEQGGFRDQGVKTKYYTGEIPKDFLLDRGEFLIAMTEQAKGLLGSSLVVPESDRFLHNQRLGRVLVRDGVQWHNDFFFHQFNTNAFRTAVQATASGVKVRHTSPKKLGEILVKYPSKLHEQAAVAKYLNQMKGEIVKLEHLYARKLNGLGELKQSLLQKAFSGELTADDTDREVESATA
ncbi:restriction endonuclease subunit S [Wenzhouxiangella sp. EGI_FJ10409]|uniref:restriction endonuclease subunit S n=1 Tax=Wenzhouxiangella sp. EGI_FJ10409 TaxID=3243767 RepID=UPI0035DE6DC9